MGLEDLLDDDEQPKVHCPICEVEGEATDYWYNRCTNDDCKVVTWIPNEHEHGFEL